MVKPFIPNNLYYKINEKNTFQKVAIFILMDLLIFLLIAFAIATITYCNGFID